MRNSSSNHLFQDVLYEISPKGKQYLKKKKTQKQSKKKEETISKDIFAGSSAYDKTLPRTNKSSFKW